MRKPRVKEVKQHTQSFLFMKCTNYLSIHVIFIFHCFKMKGHRTLHIHIVIPQLLHTITLIHTTVLLHFKNLLRNCFGPVIHYSSMYKIWTFPMEKPSTSMEWDCIPIPPQITGKTASQVLQSWLISENQKNLSWGPSWNVSSTLWPQKLRCVFNWIFP